MSPDFFGLDADIAMLEQQLGTAGESTRPALLATLAWYLRQRDTRRALTLAGEAQALLDTNGEPSDPRLLPTSQRLVLVRAEAKLLFGEPAAAAALAAAAHGTLEAMEDWAGAADALVIRANSQTQPPSLVRELMDAAMHASRLAGDEVRLAAVQGMQACVDVLADRDAAVASWSGLVDRWHSHPHPGLRAAAEMFRAHCDGQNEQRAAAAVRYERAFELNLAAGQLRRALGAAGNLVSVRNNLHEYAVSLQWCERALEIARRAGWPLSIADVLVSMGRCHHHLRQFEAAQALFEQAASSVDHRVEHRAMLCRYAGDSLSAMGRYKEALSWLRRGVIAARRAGRPQVAATCRCVQAIALSRIGRPALAVAALERAMALNQRGGRLGTRATVLHAYAAVAREHALPPPPGSAAPSAAVHYLEAALAQVAEYGGQASELWLSELSRDYERVGDHVRALACERRAVEARACTQAREAADLAASLQVRHETDRARAEAAHHKAVAEAEMRANRAKGTFLANMSHELRSPLNAMLGFTRLLLRDAESARQREELSIVLRSGEHLYGLINQVLEMSKIEAGRVTLAETDFDLHALLDELREMFSVTMHAKALALRVHCDAAVPQHVRADAMKLRQVLINLLSNSVKFTQRGSVALSVAPAAAGRLAFTVQDTGVGIAAHELALLGQPFVQAQAGQTSAEGTGLGLAISRGFVQLMGGELTLSSTPAAGTRAQFDIPVQAIEGPALPAQAPRRRVVGLAEGIAAPRILIVDDRDDGRLLLARTLAPLGFQVRQAGNGQQAVEQWHAWSPHLILMDMRMPVMDGREATRRIKAAPGGRETVIVALTASSFEEQREEILAAGCDDFMRKPFQEDALLETIARHLQLRYRYEDDASEAAPPAPDAQRLAGLPPPVRELLRSALHRLDVQAVAEALEAVREHDAPLADTLAPLARQFQYERMRALLSK